MSAEFLWLFPSASQRNTRVPPAGHSMASTPEYLPLPAKSAADIMQPLPYLDKQLPSYLDYTDISVFNNYLKTTATTEEDFAGQMMAYPVIAGINVLSAVSLSLLPLQDLVLPEPLDRFALSDVSLPRELRFWVLSRGGLPAELYDKEALFIISRYPNLYPAWKLDPDRVTAFISSVTSSYSKEDANNIISNVPEEASAYFFDPNTDLDKLLPEEVIVPYQREQFASWQTWVQTNEDILNSQRLAETDPALASKLKAATLSIVDE